MDFPHRTELCETLLVLLNDSERPTDTFFLVAQHLTHDLEGVFGLTATMLWEKS